MEVWLKSVGAVVVGFASAAAVVLALLSMGGDGGSQAVEVPEWYGTVITFFMPLGTVLGGWWGSRTSRAGTGESGSS